MEDDCKNKLTDSETERPYFHRGKETESQGGLDVPGHMFSVVLLAHNFREVITAEIKV